MYTGNLQAVSNNITLVQFWQLYVDEGLLFKLY